MSSRHRVVRLVVGGAVLSVGAVLCLLVGCSDQKSSDSRSVESSAVELMAVPEPDLSGSEEDVRKQLAGQIEKLRAARENAATATELAEIYYDLGLLYVTYSFIGAAEVCFQNAQRLRGEDFRFPYLLGYLYQIQGRLAEAKTVLERSIVLRPDDVPSLLRLGAVRLEQAKPEAARRHFARALELDPGSAAGYDGLGKVAMVNGDVALAVDSFERALDRQPSASSLRHALGLAHRSLGNLEEARRYLEQGGDGLVLFSDPLLSPVTGLGKSAELYLVVAAEAFSEQRYETAASNYRRALEINPQDFTARKALGFCLEKLGDVAGAMAQLHEALRSGDAGNEDQNRREQAEVYRILGGLSVLDGRETEAITHFESSLELDPERLDPRLKLANALARAGRFEEALRHYDVALEKGPDDTETRVRRATALINLDRHGEALAEFRRAVESDPENAEARLRYAEALAFLEDEGAAALQRQQALSLPSEDTGRASLIADQAARLLSRGEIEAALEGYREALRLDPSFTDSRFELAKILAHLGQYEDAVRAFARVIEEAPRHGPARRAQVTALLLLERYGEARLQLQQGLQVMPADRQLAHALARILASAPDDRVRDGRLAIELATKVHEAGRDPAAIETLAMAYAEAGELDRALEIQSSLARDSEESGSDPGDSRRRLASYERRRPWRAETPDEIIRATLLGPSP